MTKALPIDDKADSIRKIAETAVPAAKLEELTSRYGTSVCTALLVDAIRSQLRATLREQELKGADAAKFAASFKPTDPTKSRSFTAAKRRLDNLTPDQRKELIRQLGLA